ncbi:M56 family metallopeptidase [Hymenobacter sp. DG01]|uniref:M56 family metallopeptidase n=1 Tax=Hymenobacter sp. DG01 TaxID=2584940 RepID=UPI00111EBD69|nr:M56 family metallopeptidase [Hymenobacter sp. DG01]
MNWLEHLLPPALIRALGWTLVHSLWQGAVVALALAGLLLLLRKHSAEVRYRTAGLGLAVLLLLAAVTFGRYYMAAPEEAVAVAGYMAGNEAAVQADGLVTTEVPISAALIPADGVATTPALVMEAAPTGLQAWLVYFDQNIPVLVALWLLGLLAMTLRLLGGLAYVQRLRRYRVQPLAQEWQERLAGLAARAGLHQPIELLESALVRVPVVVGHLRPVILLPLGTVTGLSTGYLEAILAHELAHVQRRDYLMNLLQSIAETLFFYHPAVWFMTACLRTERENCCDDAATAMVGGNPLTVARALAALAELSVAPEPVNQFALSALGHDGSVLGRIRRLVQGRTAPTFSEGFMAACVVLGGMVLLTSAVAMADPRPTPSQEGGSGALARLPFLEADPDTTRKKGEVAAEFTIPDADVLLSPSLATEAPEADLAPVAEVAEVEEAGMPVDISTTQDEDDKDKKKRRKGTRQVVVVQEPVRRGGAGTVVIEKDKKGRITNLSVNGQPVDTGQDGKKKSRKSEQQQVEVIRVPANGWSGNNFRFDDRFARSFQFRGLDESEVARIRRDADRAVADARRQLRENPQWRSNTLRFRGEQTDALRRAEQSLREAVNNARTDEEREKMEEALERLHDRQESLREQLQERQEVLQDEAEEARSLNGGRWNADLNEEGHRRLGEAARREGDVARREADRARREGELARRIGELARRQAAADVRKDTREATRLGLEMKALERQLEAAHRETEAAHRETEAAHRETERVERTVRAGGGAGRPASAAEDALRAELRKDGLIKDSENFQFSLTTTALTVNGKKQSATLRDKYLRLVEKQRGRKLGPTSSYIINRQSSGSSTSYGQMQGPRPPRPPRAPQVPLAPLPPVPPVAAPAPPAPPAPPQVNSDEVRTELRKDGLLGANEKAFQLQLNESGLTVNGKKQSNQLAEKYRRLLGSPGSNGGTTRSNIQISVSE